MVRIGVIIMALAIVSTAHSGDYPAPKKLHHIEGLPDPLLTFMAVKDIRSKEAWVAKRRPELKNLFEHYMYGKAPPAPKVIAKIERTDKNALGGKATLKEITLTLKGIDGPKIHLLLVIPNKRTGPAPVFVGMNFCGNQSVLADPKIQLNPNWLYGNRKGVKDNRATDQSRGTDVGVWNIEDIIDRGYAIATFYSGDIDPDRPDERGIQKHFGKQYDWATIRAWAWGYSRVIDYLVTVDEIDATRIIAVGHSRLGKTTLLAGAFDERIAVIIPHQAGCGGSGPSRAAFGNKGAESVKRINTSFPHWFNAEFKKFNDDVERLPFDQHCLIALCAPRPVLLSNAVEDKWANPDGQFNLLVAADPVYKLMGSKGIAAKKMPAVGKLMASPLGYWIRNGKHSMNRDDWRVFLDYADVQLKNR